MMKTTRTSIATIVISSLLTITYTNNLLVTKRVLISLPTRAAQFIISLCFKTTQIVQQKVI